MRELKRQHLGVPRIAFVCKLSVWLYLEEIRCCSEYVGPSLFIYWSVGRVFMQGRCDSAGYIGN